MQLANQSATELAVGAGDEDRARGVLQGGGSITCVSSLPETRSDGSVAMSRGFSSGPVSAGVYERSPGFGYSPVAHAFETAPDAGGALLTGFGFLGLNDAGQVAFVATLDDGRSGVFLATPTVPEVPAVPIAALPLLGVLRVATAVASRQRPSAVPA